MKKIIAFDIDGTLLTSQEIVSKPTKDILKKLSDEGHHLVICSGRSNEAIKDLIKQIDMDSAFEYIVAFNGAMVENIKTGEVLFEQRLSIEDARNLFDLSNEFELELIVYYNKSILSKTSTVHNYTSVKKRGFKCDYISSANEIIIPPHKLIYVGEKESLDRLEPKIKEQISHKFSIARSGLHFLDFNSIGIDKGNGILKVSDALKINIQDVVAFGDSSNDYEMIKKVGVGVAMGNSTPDILKIADVVTLSNDEDGIVEFVNKYILNN